ncbi:hypothetical protein FACS189462_0470 [Spirochaetia bacterium]|nr:hypothetical protein FACS189462_0470 [Spirochaetia bacterium]
MIVEYMARMMLITYIIKSLSVVLGSILLITGIRFCCNKKKRSMIFFVISIIVYIPFCKIEIYPRIQEFNAEGPLIRAINKSNYKKTEKLIRKGYTINEVGGSLYVTTTPLIQAVYTKNIDMIKLLVENGADVNLIAEMSTPLQSAIWTENYDNIKYLLDHGADVHFTKERFTLPLNYAVIYTIQKDNELNEINKDIIQLLLSYGADINGLDYSGDSSLFVSFDRHHELNTDIPDYLIQIGANINLQDKQGNSILHKAIYNRNNYSIKYILENGGDIEIKNNNNQTPLEYAYSLKGTILAWDNDEIINILEEWYETN